MLSPLIGILLGPFVGALSVGLGSLVGHMIYFRDPFEFIFILGAPLGAAMASLVYERRWRPVLGIYTVLLLGFLVYPVSLLLPLWGVWDIFVGYGFVLIFSLLVVQNRLPKGETQNTLLILILCTVIGLESDILLRVFILLPGQTWWLLYAWPLEFLYVLWVEAAFVTPIKVLMGVIVTVTVGLSLLRSLPREYLQSTMEEIEQGSIDP